MTVLQSGGGPDIAFRAYLLTAFLSLILGMGLPTTANYIVVSSLLAPVIVALGQQNGLIVPLIAVHLFVFYFGIMADVTPPVGLASFAAAAVSKGDPIKTGIRSEEHTSELQSLMRISYAVFCLKKKIQKNNIHKQ